MIQYIHIYTYTRKDTDIMTEEQKKWKYRPESCKKYNQKRKKVACNLFNEEYERVKIHYTAKGFSSANSYLLHLIHKDMEE